MNSKMPGLNIHRLVLIFFICLLILLSPSFVNRKELLNNILSILELGIVLLKSQFDAHAVVFVLSQAETISLKSITV